MNRRLPADADDFTGSIAVEFAFLTIRAPVSLAYGQAGYANAISPRICDGPITAVPLGLLLRFVVGTKVDKAAQWELAAADRECAAITQSEQALQYARQSEDLQFTAQLNDEQRLKAL